MRVGRAGADISKVWLFVAAITIHNFPEGVAVGVGFAGGDAGLTAIVEPLGGFVGVSVVMLSQQLLPFALTFAAGAMIYVISHEIIPETHTRGFQREATAGLTVGLVVMMFLDVALG